MPRQYEYDLELLEHEHNTSLSNEEMDNKFKCLLIDLAHRLSVNTRINHFLSFNERTGKFEIRKSSFP